MADATVTYQNVSRETFQKIDEIYKRFAPVLENYISRLIWWNKSVNLVSRNVPIELVREHVRHSLFPALLENFHKSHIVIDAGTGGGLPGIPLSLCYGDKKMILNDVSGKKTLVLSRLKRELNLVNCTVGNYPISEYTSQDPQAECIVSKHAFKLPDLFNDIQDGRWKSLIMLKGEDFKDELENIPYPVSIECHRLETGTTLPFYRGKVMLNIQRIVVNEE